MLVLAGVCGKFRVIGECLVIKGDVRMRLLELLKSGIDRGRLDNQVVQLVNNNLFGLRVCQLRQGGRNQGSDGKGGKHQANFRHETSFLLFPGLKQGSAVRPRAKKQPDHLAKRQVRRAIDKRSFQIILYQIALIVQINVCENITVTITRLWRLSRLLGNRSGQKMDVAVAPSE